MVKAGSSWLLAPGKIPVYHEDTQLSGKFSAPEENKWLDLCMAQLQADSKPQQWGGCCSSVIFQRYAASGQLGSGMFWREYQWVFHPKATEPCASSI